MNIRLKPTHAGSAARSSRRPPALPGLPLIGNALDFRKNPVALLRRGYDTCGAVFSIRLGPMPAVVIIGPENHRFFFTETDKTLSMSDVYQAFVPIFGAGFTLAAASDEYKEQRAILAPAFQPQRMPDYIKVMVEETRSWIDTLGSAGEFDLVHAMEHLAVHTVSIALMGRDFRERMGDDYVQLYRDVVGGIEVMLPPNLPLPRFRRRDRARRTLHARIRQLIAERRANPGHHDDFLQHMAEARYSNGQLVPEGTLESMILFLVFSASESTPLQASWSLIHLLQHPAYLAGVLHDQQAALGTPGQISEEGLRRLDRLEWALKESERLRPMTTMLWRRATTPYELDGYQIPKGWVTIMCPAVAHRLAEVFPDPDVYRPERFAPPEAEDRKTPFSLVGFGGGHHKCPGTRFAYNWMKVVFSLLLERYTLTLVNPDPQPNYQMSIARPEAPCLVRYQLRSTP